jgi:hypothetical protein
VAKFAAISAAGESVIRYLKSAFAGFPGGAPTIEQVTTRSLQAGAGTTPQNFNTTAGSLTLLLYRVDVDGTPRSPMVSVPQPDGTIEKRYALPLDLRYLVTAWADQPDVQQLILGQALVALASHPTFGPSDLVATAGSVDAIWRADDSFQFLPDDMSTEDLYQIWESLGRPFELSVPFKARVVLLDAASAAASTVTQRRLDYGVTSGTA